MPPLHVREDRTGQRDGGTERERTHVRTFTVEMSSALDDGLLARAANGIPRIYTPYVSAGGVVDFGSWCVAVDADRVGDSNVWRVVARYSSRLDLQPAAGGGGGAGANTRPDVQSQPNPLLRPPVIEWDTLVTTIPGEWDTAGTPVLNSAGDPFDPPLEDEEARLYLRITKNQLAYDATGYLGFVGATNSKTFIVFRPGEVRCRKIKGTSRWENGIYYWAVVYEFEVRPERLPSERIRITEKPQLVNWSEAWTRWVLDRGFRERVPEETHLLSDYDTATDVLTFADPHGLSTGTAVTFGAGAGGGLAEDTTYYVHVVDMRPAASTKVTLHTTQQGAINETGRVDITGNPAASMVVPPRLKPILDPHFRQPVSTPWLLSGAGLAKAAGAEAVYLGYDLGPGPKDFNRLRIF